MVNFSWQFEVYDCCTCGSPIALTTARERELRKSRSNFFCPNGHPQAFFGETEAEKLRKELAQEKQRREMAERETAMERKRAEAAEKATTRLKKRVTHGVCPCCNRTFQNLARHMKTKHPKEIVKP